MTRTVRAAVIQAASVGFDTAATLDKLEALAADAAAQGAQLVLFPEAFVGGYPRGLDFGVTVGQRTDAGREWFRRYHAGAIEVPGPATERIAQIAAAHRLHLVVGVIERDGGTLYCAVLLFTPEGLVGRRRKLMPTAAERYIWGQGGAADLPVWDSELGRIGAAICWENYLPLYRMHLYQQKVALYCAPTADPRDIWLATIRHIAREGGCFVLAANQFVRGSDLPQDHPSAGSPETVLCRGGSAIVSPMGEFLAGPNVAGETILLADLDPADIVRAKFDLDVAGHYARPELLRLAAAPHRDL